MVVRTSEEEGGGVLCGAAWYNGDNILVDDQQCDEIQTAMIVERSDLRRAGQRTRGQLS